VPSGWGTEPLELGGEMTFGREVGIPVGYEDETADGSNEDGAAWSEEGSCHDVWELVPVGR
jgi:hypothetical protein